MNKQNFLNGLEKSLKSFSPAERAKVIFYYDELISDRMEGGDRESDIIASLGSVKDISQRIKAELNDERLQGSPSKRSSVKGVGVLVSLLATPVLIPFGIIFFILFITALFTLFGLVVGFGGAGLGLAIAIIPSTVAAFGEMGIAGALVVSGSMLFAISIMGILFVLVSTYGGKLLGWMLRSVSKYVKKSYENQGGYHNENRI
ncbi:MAG: DUF1700 domain-containing protein [Clostridia bacterium]